MAEKHPDQTPTLDKILECSLCHQQLRNPHRLQQCLHSFCKPCIEAVPKDTRDGKQGCLCPQCKTFSTVKEMQHDTFLDELLNLHNASTDVALAVCVQCDTQEEVSGKCADCKIELCGKCQIGHLKIPMLRGHKIVPMEEASGQLIDRIVFCQVHENEIMKLNCEPCNKVICLCCHTTGNEHDSHKTEFVNNALERMIPKMEANADKISGNIDIIKAQIEAVKCKIEEVKESYASCRLEMDDHLEKVISRLRAMKAKVEDEVTEQESFALDTLDGIKQKLEYQLSEATNIINLVAAAEECFRNVSMLTTMHGGLYSKVNNLGEKEKGDIDLQIPEVFFTESENIESTFREVFGDVRYDIESTMINPCGKIFQLQHMCDSFEELFNNTFSKDLTIDLPSVAFRLSYIDDQIWVPLITDNSVSIYNQQGELIKSVKFVKGIVVVKKTHNGDIIAGGLTGLYVVSNDLSEWSKISEGRFIDITLHRNTFSALDFGSKKILTFSYSTSRNIWTEIQSISMAADIKHVKGTNFLTLSSSGDTFVISDIVGRNVLKYETDGDCIKCNSFKDQLCIAGTDKSGKVLASNFSKGTLHLLDINSDEFSLSNIGDIKCPQITDVIIDGEQNVWCLRGNNDTFALVKFVMEK